MHRSRIGVVLIDHPKDSYDAAADFWAGVQGSKRQADASPPYESLDLETDDVPAEVARLEGQGATVLERADGWVVMTDPGGLVFCVVPVWTDREVSTGTPRPGPDPGVPVEGGAAPTFSCVTMAPCPPQAPSSSTRRSPRTRSPSSPSRG
ncbi:VOC family protein [Nocardioides sp.]|uniref:VOC family protein n=1 Tax=Nocardioides sp. TaxID=35761 RepID=UPI00344E9D88